ncbi:MAG: dTMP kinase [Desulfovibrionaceae bacterium]|nr:dTMP kinase [Desulfovibrionaceae bacterium]
MPAKFITLEGIEGSGKSTLLQKMAGWLAGRGHSVLLTCEPGGSALGRELRPLLLDADREKVCMEAELFLYLADRAEHARRVIGPALERGELVLCDRFTDSTLAYQGYGRGLDLDLLRRLNHAATGGLAPDQTLVLDLPPEMGLSRARRRNLEQGLERKEGRFEAESLAFHSRVRAGYLSIAGEEPGRVKVLDASGGPEELFSRACKHFSREMAL